MAISRKYRVNEDPELALPVPKIIYRYRGFNQLHLEIIAKRQLFFSKPECFNDPFDCVVPVRFDMLSEDEFDALSISLIQTIMHLGFKEAEQRYFEKVKPDKSFGTKEYKEKMTEEQLDALREILTVCCFSGSRDNTLLWSHYANNHQGFCIGFDRDHLYYNTGLSIGKVKYLNELPILKPTKKQEDLYIAQTLTKHEDWKYEDEYRLICFKNGSCFDFDPLAIKEIILGCSMRSEDKETIVAEVKSSADLQHVQIFEASRRVNSFGLAINEYR